MAHQHKPSLRERKKEAIRSRILEASRKLFKKRGYTAVSMDEIADTIDISRKSLFNYMTSKEAIIIALIEDLILANLSDWTEPETPHYHDPRDVVAVNAEKRLNSLGANRWLLELAAEHTHYFSPGRKAFVNPVLARNFAARSKRIAAVQKEGNLRTDIPAETISWAYEALRDVTIQRWLSDPKTSVSDLHAHYKRMTDILIAGLHPAAQRPIEKLNRRHARLHTD